MPDDRIAKNEERKANKVSSQRRRGARRLLAVGGFAVIALALWAFWLEPASLTLVEERISLPRSTPGSLRITILTDLHVGSPFNGIEKLREVVDRTNAAVPDVVCILGDLRTSPQN
jgi:uncharacterized protein